MVERQRSSTFRVELIGPQPATVIEYAARDVHFFFSGLEPKATVTRGELIGFELTSSALP